MAIEQRNYDPAIMYGAQKNINVDLGDVLDSNQNEILEFDAVASAVNFVRVTNSVTTANPILSGQGDDTNVGLTLSSKGTGDVRIYAGDAAREILICVNTASAVNEVTVTPSATGVNPSLGATGDDTNIGLILLGKGTGAIVVNNGTDPVQISMLGAAAGFNNEITDLNGNEMLQLQGVTSAVNEVSIRNAATTAPPIIEATGGDANISLRLTAKGTGVIQCNFPLVHEMTQTAITDTATLTIAQLLTKVIDGTPTAAATYTLPTAANLVGGIANAQVGDSFSFYINNKSTGANTITAAAGTGGTSDGTLTVAQDVIREFLIIVTNVTAASEAYFVYGIV